MTESEFTSRICDDIECAGGLVMPIVANLRGQPGWPDRLIIHKSWMGLAEFKAANGHLTTLQKIRIREICRRKPMGAVVVRMPGIIEDCDGVVLGTFNGTGHGFLKAMGDGCPYCHALRVLDGSMIIRYTCGTHLNNVSGQPERQCGT